MLSRHFLSEERFYGLSHLLRRLDRREVAVHLESTHLEPGVLRRECLLRGQVARVGRLAVEMERRYRLRPVP
jgi:hypothetical protein